MAVGRDRLKLARLVQAATDLTLTFHRQVRVARLLAELHTAGVELPAALCEDCSGPAEPLVVYRQVGRCEPCARRCPGCGRSAKEPTKPWCVRCEDDPLRGECRKCGVGRGLFPGRHAGRPISALNLANRMRAMGIEPRSMRNTVRAQLATSIPAAMFGEILGISPATATRWRAIANGNWAAYAEQTRCSR